MGEVTAISSSLLRMVFEDMSANGWSFSFDIQSQISEDGRAVKAAANLRWYKHGELMTQAEYDEALKESARRIYERYTNTVVKMINVGL